MTTINTQEDFLRALRENPEWREAVRALILGEEHLHLPQSLQELAETVNRFVASQERFDEEQRQVNQQLREGVEELRKFAEDQRQVNEEQRQVNQQLREGVEELRKFAEDQRQVNEEQRQVNQQLHEGVEELRQFNEEQRQINRNTVARFDRMEGDISTLKGNYALDRAIDRADVIAVELHLQYVRNMTNPELTQIALAASGGQGLVGDWRSFREADLVIVASAHGETNYLAVEVSYTAGQEDTRRAIRNARILEEQTGQPARAVIASNRNTREVQAVIDSGQVYWHSLPDRMFQRG